MFPNRKQTLVKTGNSKAANESERDFEDGNFQDEAFDLLEEYLETNKTRRNTIQTDVKIKKSEIIDVDERVCDRQTRATNSSLCLPSSQNKPPNCFCLVCQILQKPFSAFTFEEKRNVISTGRPTPEVNLETNVESVKKSTRHFKLEFYDKYKWLTGCSTFTKLFCWPCLLFTRAGEISRWTSNGYSDLNNFHKNAKRHSNTKGHLTSVFKEKTFGKPRGEHLDSQLKVNYRLHNDLVAKNRDVLKRLIDATCLLRDHELGVRVHQENNESTNPVIYSGVIELLAKYDGPLKTHLRESTIFQGTSSGFHNDLIKCVADVVLDNIKKEIKDAPFVSIVLSGTADKCNVCQLAVVVRYVKLNETVQERFLRYLDSTVLLFCQRRTAEAVFKIVCDIVEELECGPKLVAQSYDGAAVTAGHLGCLQAKVKAKFQHAIFVHCFAHRLNLVLSQSVGTIKDCKVFFSTLSGMAEFFSRSSKRTRAFDIKVEKKFPKVASTRLTDNNGRLVQIVSQYRVVLIELFQDILNNKDQWDPETVNSSRGYLELLENDFNFNFMLNVFSEIFPYVDVLFDILQTKSNDIGPCVQHIKFVERKLNTNRAKFQHFWEKTINLVLEPERKRMRLDNVIYMEASYRQLYIEIMDNISQEMTHRFQNFNELKFIELCNFNNHKRYNFPKEAFNSLKLVYGNFFDTVALRSQLNVFYDNPPVNYQKTPLNMLLFLKDGLEEPYAEVLKLCQLVLTIPAVSASVGRGFSTLKRIKNFVRNSADEEISSHLAMISIEKESIRDLSQNPRFYEDVIDKFANVDRRIELHYK